jgi:hypothetical protein
MSYPIPLEIEDADSLYKEAIFFYNEYERMKNLYNTCREILLGMLHQHGDNFALSDNGRACNFLGHPRATEPYKGDRCYCRLVKYDKKGKQIK